MMKPVQPVRATPHPMKKIDWTRPRPGSAMRYQRSQLAQAMGVPLSNAETLSWTDATFLFWVDMPKA